MKNPTMLYRCPGPETFEGVSCETTIVDEADMETALADGWHRDWMQADAAMKDAQAKLATNESELADVIAKLKAAGELKAVHKGRGVYELQDKDGNVIQSGLTKEEAQAATA